MNTSIMIMSWLGAIFTNSKFWRGISYGLGIAVLAGMTQFVLGSDSTTRLIEEIKHSADIYCSAPKFDQYALKRIMEDAIIPHRIRIEC